MKVASVTVNYKTADLALRAIEAALADLEPLHGKAFLVDNDSGDGSLERLRQGIADRGLGPRVELIASPRNVGFGAGNNLAFRAALASDDPPDYFYLLNPDAKPYAGALRVLVDFMDAHPTVGIAGSRVRHPGGEVRHSAFRFPSVVSELEAGLHVSLASKLLERWRVPAEPPTQTGPVDWVSGASVMLRTAMLRDVGMFDENFFLYYEETDLCLRAARAGWTTWYVLESEAEHIGQVSTGMKDRAKPRPRFWFESRAYYLRKNYGPLKLLAANAAFASAYSVYEIRKRLGKPEVDPPGFYRDFLRFNFARKK
jgi:N-acetylglucosaminyl-diphospho-decaprenol L-rhamnosyltransferase